MRKRVISIKPNLGKGSVPPVQNKDTDNEMTREECITDRENQKVLNGRVFDSNILTKFGMSNIFDGVYLKFWDHPFEPQHHIYLNLRCTNFTTKWSF